MIRSQFLALIVALVLGCQSDLPSGSCVEGQFLGYYCEGAVIKILDDSGIGRDWIGVYDSIEYRNAVVASVDTVMIKSVPDPQSYFSKDSVFYFQYRKGGYPRNQYNLCEPAAFLTITYLSKQACKNDE